MRRTFIAALLLLAAAHAAAQRPADTPARVLFIGNSLVASTNVPGRLQRLGAAMGRPLTVDAVTANDFSLEDHWNDGRAAARIKEGWDFVVLQQGPSSQVESRAALLEYSRRFAALIRAAGARPAIFAAWPAQSRAGDFPESMRSHRMAAKAIDAVLIPASEGWLRALSADRSVRLYADGLHATAAGSDLAVLAAWFALFPAGPQEFDESYVARISRDLRIPAATRDAIFDAATRAIDEPLPLE